MKRLTLGAVFFLLIAACDHEPNCGRDDLRYSRELGRCTCANGGEYVPEELVCILPDGAVVPLGDGGPMEMADAGMEIEPDAGMDAGIEVEPDACAIRTFYRDADGDEFGDPTQAMEACDAPEGYVENDDDCADDCAACHPGAAEVCDAAERDESCSGGANEGCACTPGASRPCPGGSDVGECAAGTQSCAEGGTWGECEGVVSAVAETCNGRDDDCDTVVDGPTAALACGSATRATGVGCTAGECVVTTCAPGYADCDGEFENGCEQELGTVDHCLACGDSCAFGCDDSGCNEVRAVSAGAGFSCVVRDNGDYWCWGAAVARVGEAVSRPVGSPHLADLESIAVGSSDGHRCAVRDDGRAVCWGQNFWGQLGRVGAASSTPVEVTGLTDVEEVVVGGVHSCARRNGEVWCWGYGDFGNLGNGADLQSNVPVRVSGLADAIAIAAGGHHACAVRATGAVVCWGYNYYGQLGNGGTSDANVPVSVVGISDAIAIASGTNHVCTVLTTGRVRCWGANDYGQLGNGTTSTRETSPVLVSDIADAAGVRSGGSSNCVRSRAGSVRCWGSNGAGQIGDGSTETRSSPAAVILTDVDDLAFSGAHGCALRADGGVWCWGFNNSGQVGDGMPMMNRARPVRIMAE